MATTAVTFTGDDAKLMRALDKVIQKERQLARSAAETGTASEKASRRTARGMNEAGQAREKAFGAGAVRQVAAFAAGIVGVTTVLGKVKQMFADIEQATKDAAEANRTVAQGYGRLAQVTEPGQLAGAIARAETTAAEGRMPRAQALALQFELESGGFRTEQDRAFFSRVALIGDTTTLAKGAGAFRKSVGAAETGTARDIVSKALAAAGPVSGAGGADILAAANVAAPFGQLLPAGAGGKGLRDEEIMGAISLIGQRTGDVGLAGTQARALFAVMVEEKVRGETLAEKVRTIEGMGLSDPQLLKFFGRKEAFGGYAQLIKGGLEERVALLDKAQREGFAGQRLGEAERQPLIRAALMADEAKARLAQGRQKRGDLRNITNAILDDETTRLEGEDRPGGAWWRRRRQISQRWAFGEEAFLEQEGTDEQRMAGFGPERIQQRIAYHRRMIGEYTQHMEEEGANWRTEHFRDKQVEQMNELIELQKRSGQRATLAPANQDEGVAP